MLLTKSFYCFLLRKRIAAAERISAELRTCVTRQAKEAYQLKKFNVVWEIARKNVPFYKEWYKKFSLPDAISSLNELNEWPILTKADLRNQEAFRRADIPEPKGRIMTGGSTGEPVRLPSLGDAMADVSQRIGRKAYGIEPGDSTFLLWGHEHLYGTGFRRRVNAYKRRLKDWFAGWKRVSAYDLGANAMHRAYKVFSNQHPKFVIGFSPAILAFVRHNALCQGRVKSVRVILCTAGPLTKEEKTEIEQFFEGKVAMEYGSVECGIMAYTRPSDGDYDVFWNTHLLQAVKDGDEYQNIVTRLTDCYVPLIRYKIGDFLELDPLETDDSVRSVLHIKSIKGRPSEMITFKCGVSFFGALIGDCIKQVPEIIMSQIAVNEDNNTLEIRVVADEHLTNEKLSLVKNRFELTVENAARLDIKIIQVEKLFTTVGGKIPRVVRTK
jgi:phenylacetate-coenzyme A ligase PaaK-like adenylate-forming protein